MRAEATRNRANSCAGRERPVWVSAPVQPEPVPTEVIVKKENEPELSGSQTLVNRTWGLIRGACKWVADTATSYVSAITEYFTAGGPLQKRLYYHLLTPLITETFHFLSDRPLSENLDEQIRDLQFELRDGPYHYLLHRDQCQNEMQKHLHDAFQLLFTLPKPEMSYSQIRWEFFQHLHAAQRSEHYVPPGDMPFEEIKQQYPHSALMMKLGHILFAGVNVNNYASDAMSDVLRRGKVRDRSSIEEQLKEDTRAINAVPAPYRGGKIFETLNKLRGHFNKWFYPLMTNNFSSELWKQQYEHHTATCLAFGTPTSEIAPDPTTLPTILPSFRLFLDYLKANNKTLMSFQLQYPIERDGGGNEAHRIEAIRTLKNDYPKTFKPFYLRMDGKIDMLDHEKGSTKNFVESHYFGGRKLDTLNANEREVFRVLFYVSLQESLVWTKKPDYYHTQCKDAMDRAMVILSTTYYINLLRQGKENDPEALEQFRHFVFFRPLLIKGIAMHGGQDPAHPKGRFKMLCAVMRHLEQLDEGQKQNIQKHGKGLKYIDSTVTKNPLQRLELFPSQAPTLKEYNAALAKEKNLELNFFVPGLKKMLLDDPRPEAQCERDLNGINLVIGSAPVNVDERKEKFERFLLENVPTGEQTNFKRLYNQAALSPVAAYVQQRYKTAYGDNEIIVSQNLWEQNKRNTAIKPHVENGRLYVDYFQTFKIEGERIETHYVRTRTRLDYYSGDASVTVDAPTKAEPQAAYFEREEGFDVMLKSVIFAN